jgi:hypothetical protein
VAAVLLVVWYVARREGLLLGIAVAIVALPAAYHRSVLGIPAAFAMALAAVHAPGLAAAAVAVVVLIAIVAGFVYWAFNEAPYRPRRAGADRTLSGSASYIDGGGWFDGGGSFDAGGDCS